MGPTYQVGSGSSSYCAEAVSAASDNARHARNAPALAPLPPFKGCLPHLADLQGVFAQNDALNPPPRQAKGCRSYFPGSVTLCVPVTPARKHPMRPTFLLLACAAFPALAGALQYPQTERGDVIDDYFGT